MTGLPQKDLTRVSDRIADVVLEFYRATLAEGTPWTLWALAEYVAERGYTAPDSPGRILRSLRQSGKLNYVVLSRSQSLYESLPVGGMRKPPVSQPRAEAERYGS